RRVQIHSPQPRASRPRPGNLAQGSAAALPAQHPAGRHPPAAQGLTKLAPQEFMRDNRLVPGRKRTRIPAMRTRIMLALVLVPSPAFAAEWPGWRGPAGTGLSPEKDLPTKWSGTENVRWKTVLQGAGVGTPIVWQDHVVLTTSEGRLNDRLYVHAFD